MTDRPAEHEDVAAYVARYGELVDAPQPRGARVTVRWPARAEMAAITDDYVVAATTRLLHAIVMRQAAEEAT
ncbi:MAG TPA: hypothetical protein VGP26_25425 [Actinophytocola sp.]|jgi:hypothetical protein|nr:hypothetical protein [Actinophytocola sp.]